MLDKIRGGRGAFSKRLGLLFAVLIPLALAGAMFAAADYGNRAALSSSAGRAYPVIIVDAGHGGADGGAVGADGTVEKDINLAIALRLSGILRAWGYEVIMTREDDRSVHSPEATTLRGQKASDLHNRTDLVNSTPGAVLVSIHQNKFHGTTEHGTQVFYSPNNPESQALAQAIQQRACELLQPDNRRKIKKAGSNIYLLYYAQAPAVMVECGFLSNVSERERLKDPDYQGQIAFSIACALAGRV
jgi:N-acetylmuramoyl-L-alanine amidase